MPAVIIAWLAAHQAIAATLTVWLGLTAAGIDVVDKAIELKNHVVAEEPAKPEAPKQ